MTNMQSIVFAAPRPESDMVELTNTGSDIIAHSSFKSSVMAALEDIPQKLKKGGTPKTHHRVPLPDNWAVRDQEGRGTCVAFTMVSALEILFAKKPEHAANPPMFSEEYLYSKMRREFHDYGPRKSELGATFMEQALRALLAYGACPLQDLPYQGAKPHPAWSVSDTTAHDTAAAQYALDDQLMAYWRRSENGDEKVPVKAKVLAAFMQLSNTPLCAAFPIYPDKDILPWTYGTGWDTGVVPEPRFDQSGALPNDFGGHSVCIVGWVKDCDAPGHGWFIFRNSWGLGFGERHTPYDPLRGHLPEGYGALSFEHFDQHCWEITAFLN